MSVTKMNSKVVASRKASGLHANRLLGLLPPSDYKRLRPHLHRIPLEYRQSLYRVNKPIEFVYFIETGVGSLVNTMRNGDAAEVGTIGNEGVVININLHRALHAPKGNIALAPQQIMFGLLGFATPQHVVFGSPAPSKIERGY